MEKLRKDFADRDTLIGYVRSLSPWCEEHNVSKISGTYEVMQERLDAMDPLHYGKTRNHMDGKVTKLSPYIRHGVVSLNTVRNAALAKTSNAQQIEKFIQELAWRDFWQRIYAKHPNWIWEDIEPYKTGFSADDYTDALPEDIQNAQTDCACINDFIRILLETGYMHNHTRMYVASYIVHWRRVKWQAGARWMHHHLLDGDLASNNLSWQWVASTFANKPYIFNLENVQKYASKDINTNVQENTPLHASYEALAANLFPHKEVNND